MDVVLAEGVLDVVGLLVVLPVLVQLVDLAGDVALLLSIKALEGELRIVSILVNILDQ